MGIGRVTPVRRQYLELKARHPDAILLFRLGDFYETFDEDAKLVAAELDIALTSKPMGAGLRSPLAGVPVRSVEQHLARLVARGHRVAICEQLERPSASRGLVRRGVVRVVSPGTALEPALLEAGEASACAAVWAARARGARGGLRLGIAAADITTGACHLAELNLGAGAGEREAQVFWQQAADQLARLGARELIVAEGDDETARALAEPDDPGGPVLTPRSAHEFGVDRAERAVARQYAAPAAAFGLERDSPALPAVGALLGYLRQALPEPERHAAGAAGAAGAAEAAAADGSGDEAACDSSADGLAQLAAPRWLDAAARLSWDRATGRALAIVEADTPQTGRGGAAETLLGTLDRCATALGRRWLRAALAAPLLDLERIGERLDRVESLTRAPALRRALAARLRGMADLERLLGRAASGLDSPAELRALAAGLAEAQALAALIGETAAGGAEAEATERFEPADAALARLRDALGPAPESAAALLAALREQPAAEFGRGVVQAGADSAVDGAAARVDRCRERLAALEGTLREESGIATATIGYHRTFGYQIELTRGQAGRAPESWERRQSLRERERFTEPRLRALAAELEEAEELLAEAERSCVERLRAGLVAEAAAVRRRAGAVARLDAAAALAEVAVERAWTRPELDHSSELVIESGRHPILEARASAGGFVPNDLRLGADGVRAPQLVLVTGPNMAGKSTYLRQAALIVVLAQAGAFVPAARARVGLVDRIFARVGAHDELVRGRSTFMVEMLETARLLHGAGERSLVLLDEIGRGTSTWDGMAIARAVAEELAGRPERGPRTLFATHFHELTALSGELGRIENASVQVAELASGELVFPYRVAAGAADRSYGVQVARQAGLPERVVRRAAELLARFEQGSGAESESAERAALAQRAQIERGRPAAPQLMLIPPLHPILSDLSDLDVDGLTPLEAISALYALRDQARAELRGHERTELVGRTQADLRGRTQ
ncbi:MAG: DNA mismatch repair protein MutS, partial [Chloroflexi bacterium]|nr:DNA mismatch repair protein MutS [Chloroflexota bacterium]